LVSFEVKRFALDSNVLITAFLWLLVFPIQGKILKPGFPVAEERNPEKLGFFRVLK